MAVTKKPTQRVEARADTSTPSTTDPTSAPAEVAPTTYRYVGGMNAVVVVVDGTGYDFRHGEPVHLAHPVEDLDANPDFERVEAGETG